MLAGVLLWAMPGVRMMLTVAHSVREPASLFRMGTAVATGLRYAGWTLLTFRDPLQDFACPRTSRSAPPAQPPEMPRPAPRRS